MKTIAYTLEDIILSSKLNSSKNIRRYKYKKLILMLTYMPIGILLLWGGTLISNDLFHLSKGSDLAIYSTYIYYYAVTLCGSFTFFIGLRVVLSSFIIKRYAKKIWKTNKSLKIPLTITWSNDKLFIHSTDLNHEMSWSIFYTSAMNDDYLLLYFSIASYLIIPKNCFENNREMQDFLNHLESGIKINKESNQ